MIHDRIDPSTLRALSPHAVAAYLKSKGWVDQGRWGEFALLFARDCDGKRSEAVVPTKPTILDFGRRMAELLHDVAEAEDRPQSQVLYDFVAAPFDVLRIRARDADEYGAISLNAGCSLVEDGRNLFVTAAIQTASPRPRAVVRGRRPDEANAYLERVRLGQTERGSFGLTLLSPYSFDPADQSATQALLLDDRPPFARRVAINLAKALQRVGQALEQSIGADTSVFGNFVSDGVSAKLCATLARLADRGGGTDVSVSWSPQKPLPASPTLSLQRSDAAILKEAAAILSAAAEPETVLLVGTVLGITEQRDQFDGTVILHVNIDGRPRSVRTRFADSDRDTVFEAFRGKTDLLMTVEGELVTEGRHLRLWNPRNFGVTLIEEA